jgi:carbon-monoxide dehydrogenase medium subunit
VKAAPFALSTPESLEEAVACLTEHGGDARLLAGGQSLMPLLAMRRQSPRVLVDLRRLTDLTHIVTSDGHVEIGAMTRQRAVERNPGIAADVRLLALAVPQIAHVTIRNQGTVGGSIAHADPSAELPAVALATDATMIVVGPNGRRSIAAADFFVDAHATAMAGDELLTEIRFPLDPPGSGWAFVEISRRPGDVAIVGVAAMVRLDDGRRIAEARIVVCSVAPTPVRATEAEAILLGNSPSAELFADSATAAAVSVEPPSDLNGTSAYRRHIAALLVRRALTKAVDRAAR